MLLRIIIVLIINQNLGYLFIYYFKSHPEPCIVLLWIA